MNPTPWSHFGGSVNPMPHSSTTADSTGTLALPSSSASSASTSSATASDNKSNSSVTKSSSDSGSALLRSLPTDSSGVIAATSATTMDGSATLDQKTDGPSADQVPRRNLSEAFEELYIAAPEHGTPAMKTCMDSDKNQVSTNMISPTGVADLHPASPEESPKSEGAPLPYFSLHKDLQRDLSQAVINRVSFYGVIHDINKEASAMAANDDSGLNRAPEDMQEECSPLVEAVKGPSANRSDISSSMISAALIDEERWLLSAIETRGDDEIRPIQACPPTFLQAMGEREYENPLASLSSGSRTQLWKPSRSWWEAKSGKNPWIEPKSHNKRWRYLWPLIHYHKFLAKCIKKLKRNGVDVKMSVSPVAAFLREEVCAVSDHLATVSLFDSEEWMGCLQHFTGWTDTRATAQTNLRMLVAQLHLRPLAEHGDVESPLLRSQIDEQFLRAMAAARSQMELGSEQDRQKHGGKPPTSRPPHHPRHGMENLPPHMHQVPNHVGVGGQGHRGTGIRRPRLGYSYPHQWWGQGWHQGHHPHQYPFGDDASVHSSLSSEAFSEFGMYGAPPGPNGPYYPPAYHHPHGYDHSHGPGAGYDPNMAAAGDHHGMYPMHAPYHPEHAGLGFFGHAPVDPSMAYGMQHDEMGGYYGVPPTPKSPHHSSPAPHHQGQQHTIQENGGTQMDGTNAMAAGAQTPYKYDPSKTPRSPYWGHLDATIAMGLSTPQTHVKENHHPLMSPEEGGEEGAVGAAQPLLLRGSQYYGYGPVSNYGPPSPATQFLMSPQANFAFNYGYGYSPANGHLPAHFKQSPGFYGEGTNLCSSLKEVAPGLSPSASTRRKQSALPGDDRESPSTVETITESETLSEGT
ncbi:expressed unknown protein [Seminavis robusta]|uniref:Uncharacterized protein n=1 Tax=Seminavis robusta TaxID=568900 RepID=A0A9N8DL18_9STRA|nr:expressed unknown protein [Seminavis robusta]|eukprot:Sro188_g081340.1 n/a (857) ;mRNA; r:91052-93787